MMVMRLFKRHCAISVCGGVFFMLQTMCNHQVNPVEYSPLQGNIVGKISTASGNPAKGVTVSLAPADYNPFEYGNSVAIASTTTNDEGGYAFSVQSSGFYTVTSRSASLMSYQDSVYGAQNMQFDAATDTLKETGSVTGIVRLRPGDDNRSAVILVLGTSVYSQPHDSVGNFVIDNLAEGEYRLTILTTEVGYGILDTLVQIVADNNSTIENPLVVPWVDIPAIGQVKAELNAAMDMVALSWPPIDTTNVKQLYVFRNSSIAQTPIAVLKNFATVFVDDSLSSFEEGDTLRYTVAACGANKGIGPVGVAPEVLYKNLLIRIGSIPFDPDSRSAFSGFTVDGKNNVYLYGAGRITKLDSTGRLLEDYCSEYCKQSGSDDIFNLKSSGSAADNNGNIYLLNEADSLLMRLSDDLSAKQSIIFTHEPVFVPNSLFAGDGGLLIVSGRMDTLWKLDTSLMILDTLLCSETPYKKLECIHNDNLIFTGDLGRKIYFVDITSFTAIDSIELNKLQPQYDSLIGRNAFVERPSYLPKLEPFRFSMAANVMVYNNGLLSFGCNGNIFFVDEDKQLVGRIHDKDIIYQRRFFDSDGVDRLFTCNSIESAIVLYKIKWSELYR